MTQIFTAIGNACTDLIASVDEQFLIDNKIPKSFCAHLTSHDQLDTLKSAIGPFQTIPGGAGANVAHVIAALGGEAHFISKIAADPEGLYFKAHMEEHGISCHFPPPSPANLGSTIVVTLVTPDGERTFISYDVVARTMSFKDYNPDLLAKTKFLYLDGYSFCSKDTGESFIKASEIVIANGGHATFNVGDLSIYEENKPSVEQLMGVCDSIMCNRAEAEAFFGNFATPQLLVKKMAKKFVFGAVTDGKNGATVFNKDEIAHIQAIDIQPADLKDTNGAGDHFSGGFIFGLMNGYSLEQSGKLGVLCANDCISHCGARPLGGLHSLNHLAVLARK